RDLIVTGVQTCALRSSFRALSKSATRCGRARRYSAASFTVRNGEDGNDAESRSSTIAAARSAITSTTSGGRASEQATPGTGGLRSEERRVGKEGREEG